MVSPLRKHIQLSMELFRPASHQVVAPLLQLPFVDYPLPGKTMPSPCVDSLQIVSVE